MVGAEAHEVALPPGRTGHNRTNARPIYAKRRPSTPQPVRIIGTQAGWVPGLARGATDEGGDVKRPTPGDRGAAAVEFAFVSLLLFALLFGIIQYAYFFFQSQGASATTREAARLAAVGVTDCATFRDAVVSRATANGTTIATPSTDIKLTISKGEENDPANANAQPGDRAVVVVTWVVQKFGFPLVPFLSGDQDAAAETRVENAGTMIGLTC